MTHAWRITRVWKPFCELLGPCRMEVEASSFTRAKGDCEPAHMQSYTLLHLRTPIESGARATLPQLIQLIPTGT